MKLIAVNITYRESPSLMSEMIASLGGVADALVCVDGAIARFPGAEGQPSSPIELQDAIVKSAAAVRLPLLFYRPDAPFANEPEKRNLSLDLAATIAEPGDWLFVIDSDEVITHVSDLLRPILEESDMLAAKYGLASRVDPILVQKDWLEQARGVHLPTEAVVKVRALYRWDPTLRYGPAHFILRNGNGDFVWAGDTRVLHEVPALDVTRELKLDHRPRDRERIEAAKLYYRTRDLAKVEDISDLIPPETSASRSPDRAQGAAV